MMKQTKFEERRQKLIPLSNDELNKRFWDLTEQIVQPLVEMARTHTTPSIERSVLLRGGLSSLEAAKIVQLAFEKGLLGLGAGHLVLRLSQKRNISFIEAGRKLAGNIGWDEVRDAD